MMGKLWTPLQEEILNLLREGPMTRDEMVERLSRARTTIYDNIATLMSYGRIERWNWHDGITRGKGRPRVLFGLTKREEK